MSLYGGRPQSHGNDSFVHQRPYATLRDMALSHKHDGPRSTVLSRPIATYELVRLTRAVEADNYSIPEGTPGTVVEVYDRGAVYAVEIADLPGGPEVVTLRADQIERMHCGS